MNSRRFFPSFSPRLKSATRSVLVVAVVSAEALLGSARAGQSSSAPSSAVANRQTLRGHVPAVVSQLAPLGQVAASTRLNLALGLPLRDPAGLSTFLRQISDPASPLYRHYLTPQQFADRFGPTEQDYQAVQDFARNHGLTVTTTFA